jgi:integrase
MRPARRAVAERCLLYVYDLRRTAARNMRRAGVYETTIMAITGHRTRNMFDRYNIVDKQDSRDAAVKTTAYVSTLPAASTVIPLHPVEAIRP